MSHTAFLTRTGSVLALNDLRLKVKLGVPDDERRVPQDVSISFRLYYEMLPSACETDNPYGITCYFGLSERIKDLCKSREFKTLEFLAHFLYSNLQGKMDEGVKIRICVEKCKPPVEGVLGTTSFECGDEI